LSLPEAIGKAMTQIKENATQGHEKIRAVVSNILDYQRVWRKRS